VRASILLLIALGVVTALAFSPAPQAAFARPARQAHAARAASGGPVINWASGMIYAGLNNGNPEGPVGELAGVNGSGFTPSASVNLVLAPGDSASNPAVCQSGAIALASSVTVQNDGTFSFSFTWPSSASSGDYSVCALNSSDGSVITGADGGPFHVLSANQPAIQVSSASVAIGSFITVSGANWLPPQPINVFIGTCHNCNASPIVNATPTSDSSGAFSVKLAVPPGTAVGSYVVSAFSANNDVLDVGLTGGAVEVSIVSAGATPTTQTTTTATTQPTTTATSSATASGGSGGQNTSGGADNTPYIIAMVVSATVLLLALVGLIAYLVLRRRRNTAGAAGAASPAGGAYAGAYPAAAAAAAPNAYATPGSRPSGGASGNTPPDWRVLPNWNNATTEYLPGGAVGGQGQPSAPGVPGAAGAPNAPTPPMARRSPLAPQQQPSPDPLTQSTQPAISDADDAPTLPGSFPD